MVAGPVPAKRRDDAERDPSHRGDDDREQRELDGRGDGVLEVGRNRLVRQGGLPKVAADEMAEVYDVADREWPVESVVLLEGSDGCGVGRGLVAEIDRGRIARDELGETEDEKRDPDHEEHEGQQSLEREVEEAREPPAPDVLGCGRSRRRDRCRRQGIQSYPGFGASLHAGNLRAERDGVARADSSMPARGGSAPAPCPALRCVRRHRAFDRSTEHGCGRCSVTDTTRGRYPARTGCR